MEHLSRQIETEEALSASSVADTIDDLMILVKDYFTEGDVLERVAEFRTMITAFVQDIKSNILFDLYAQSSEDGADTPEALSDIQNYLAARYLLMARGVFRGCSRCAVAADTLKQQIVAEPGMAPEEYAAVCNNGIDDLVQHIYAHLHAIIVQSQQGEA